MSGVLVDSSAWISFFRGDRAAIQRIDALLAEDRVSICGPVLAELLSGARTRSEVNRLKVLLAALPQVPEPAEVWRRVGELRFELARLGAQASLVDLFIAISSADAGLPLLTRDRDFTAIRRALPLELEVF